MENSLIIIAYMTPRRKRKVLSEFTHVDSSFPSGQNHPDALLPYQISHDRQPNPNMHNSEGILSKCRKNPSFCDFAMSSVSFKHLTYLNIRDFFVLL